LEPTASNKNRTRQTEVASFVQDKEFACITENFVRGTNTKDVSVFPDLSHSKKASNLIILCPDAVARFSLVSDFSERDASFSHPKSFSQI